MKKLFLYSNSVLIFFNFSLQVASCGMDPDWEVSIDRGNLTFALKKVYDFKENDVSFFYNPELEKIEEDEYSFDNNSKNYFDLFNFERNTFKYDCSEGKLDCKNITTEFIGNNITSTDYNFPNGNENNIEETLQIQYAFDWIARLFSSKPNSHEDLFYFFENTKIKRTAEDISFKFIGFLEDDGDVSYYKNMSMVTNFISEENSINEILTLDLPFFDEKLDEEKILYFLCNQIEGYDFKFLNSKEEENKLIIKITSNSPENQLLKDDVEQSAASSLASLFSVTSNKESINFANMINLDDKKINKIEFTTKDEEEGEEK